MDLDHRTQHTTTSAATTHGATSPGKRTLTEGLAVPHRDAAAASDAELAGSAAATSAPAPLPAAASSVPRPTLQMLFGSQRAATAAPAENAPAAGHRDLPSDGGGQAMPEDVQAKMSGAFGTDLSSVRIFEGARAPALGARAFTTGTEVHFAPGEYQPTSQSGQELLGHELAHVVQQSQGRVHATAQAKGVAINDDAGLEHEADEMGARAARGEAVGTAAARVGAVPAGGAAGTQLARAEGPTEPVVQRVRGGIEYTEDAPTRLAYYTPPAAPGMGVDPVNQAHRMTIGGATISAFFVNDATALGALQNTDHTLLTSGSVKLTNDVRSAEWKIERHGADVPANTMLANLNNDLEELFSMRNELAAELGIVETIAQLTGRPLVVLAPGNIASLHLAPHTFVYTPGPCKGKAQITVQYTNKETIERINLLNSSKFLTGTKVADGEDTARVSHTEGQGLLDQDLAGTTSFSSAQALLGALKASSQAIPRTVPLGSMLPAPLRLTANDVGLIKLMVVNDAMATTMSRYNAQLGQAEDKNIQRFFPKSRRDEYTKAVARANLDANEMAALRVEINRTAAADAQLLYNSADAGALLVDKTFNALGVNHVDMPGMLTARMALHGQGGPPNPADVALIKQHVLGANGATVAVWIGRAANAYTDTTVLGTDQYQGGGNGNVIRSTDGFTPVAGGGRGAVYEMREREIGIDRSGWLNIGSMNDIRNAITALFRAG